MIDEKKELPIAMSIIQQYCMEHFNDGRCTGCKMAAEYVKDCQIPMDWEIPTPPPEPKERRRIDWIRIMSDDDMLDAMFIAMYDGAYRTPDDWWFQKVPLEQLQREVGLL